MNDIIVVSTPETKTKLNLYTNDILGYAYWYIHDWGFPIIPLDEHLQPLIEAWKEHRVKDTRYTMKDVEEWLGRWPHMTLGMATGRNSGFVVVRVKREGDVNRWPMTACWTSGDDDTNLLLWHPGNLRPSTVRVPNKQGFFPDTDVFGEDGYVALPISDEMDACERWLINLDELDQFGSVPSDILPLIVDDPDACIVIPQWIKRKDVAYKYLQELARLIPNEYRASIGWPEFQKWNTEFDDHPYDISRLRELFESVAFRSGTAGTSVTTGI